MVSAARAACLLLCLGVLAPWASGRGKPARGAAPVFRNLPATPEALLERAVACLNRGDTAGFYRLGVTRREYLALYPYLDRADTTDAEDRDFRMGFFLMDNRKMIVRLFQDHGRAGLGFSRLAFFAPPENRDRFSYHGSFHAWVMRGGREVELPIAKSLIRVDGGWKFWSFKAD
jgi:hypothetical protein